MRFALVITSQRVAAHPGTAGDLVLSREPGDNNEAGAFYYRDKLNGSLVFSGADFDLLYAIETSTGRCQTIGLLVEHRAYPGAPWETWRGSFTCNDCTDWDTARCTVKLSPALADPYAKLLDNYEHEYNILLTPTQRVTVTAQLATLSPDTDIEFIRVGKDEQADYIGTDGWLLFWDNQSYIYKGQFNISSFFLNPDNVLFRYRQRNYQLPMVNGAYVLIDRSDSGWTPLVTTTYQSTGKVDYVKTPSIAGFRAYKLTGSGSGTPFLYTHQNGDPLDALHGLYTYGSGEFLVLDCGKKPSDVGLPDADWEVVTGPDDYGANNSESPGGTCLNIREETDDENFRAIYWRFGNFKFTQCLRYIDVLHNLLQQTVAPFGGGALVPPTANQLSTFLTAPQNPATGQSGPDNEIPRLLVAAGSDVKRYGASEPATRLLISLKQFLEDSKKFWDAGWFIDPATGWLRFEDRSYLETQQSLGSVVDLQTLEDARMGAAYSYRTESQPRYEELAISSASTEDMAYNAYFSKAAIDYGLSACVNTKEGSNKISYTVSRLTGDVAAGVLNGESIPDSAIFILAPDEFGRLPNANRELSCSQLLLRYWRRGRVFKQANVEGPAPYQLPNTVTGTPPVYGVPMNVLSVRPQRVQTDISGKLPLFATLAATARYTSNQGEGAKLGKGELNLKTRKVTVTLWHKLPDYTAAPPVVRGTFDDSFNQSFHK